VKKQAVKLSIIIALLLVIITGHVIYTQKIFHTRNTESLATVEKSTLSDGSIKKETSTGPGSITVEKKVVEETKHVDVSSQTKIKQTSNAKSVPAGGGDTPMGSAAVSSEVNTPRTASEKKESAVDSGDATKNTESTSAGSGECRVEIAIIGKEGRIVYGPATVAVKENDRWGLTVLGALDTTGIEYNTSPTYAGFVISIAGQANKGMSGWMYKVNDEVPMAAASEKKIKPGDRIIWWYSESINTPSPTWESLEGNAPQN